MSQFFKNMGIADTSLEEYISTHTTHEDPLLAELFRDTYVNVYHPRRTSDAQSGRFLGFLVQMIKPGRILEIGTFTGYGAISMAGAMPKSCEIDTIEVDEEISERAKEWISKSQRAEQIHLITGDARELIPNLNQSYDLVFMDGDKDQYLTYYQVVKPKVAPGGFIIADNVLWSGKVLKPSSQPGDHFTNGLQAFNDWVQKDPEVENQILPIFDGIMIIRKC